MSDKTVVSRVRRQRQARLAEGWHEVTVWVPTEADAEDVRRLAEERRARAEALDGLSQEVGSVNKEVELRTAEAILKQGSKAYTTESGAVLELMTDLAREDDLQGFSRAVVIFARAKPANAHYVIGSVPAKISNFLISHRGVDAAKMMRWMEKHPGWVDDLKAAVRDPARFEAVVEAMAEAIKGDVTEH